jgi:hypothetical protein
LPKPNALKVLLSIWRRKSIWDLDHIKQFLAKHISPQTTFSDTEIPLAIVCSDLRSKKSVTYSSASNDQDFVINAVLDSISIPLAFRVWNTDGGGQLLVDGGLCENLPVSSLDGTERIGRILAFGFPRRAGSAPTNALQFFLALFEVAIANSEDRARRSLAGHRFFPISTDLDTFDFEAAVTEGLRDSYKVITYQVKEFLDDFVKTEAPGSPVSAESLDAWTTPDKETEQLMLALGDIFYSQHASQKLKYHSVVYEMTAGKPPSDLDTTRVTSEFEPIDERVFCSVFGFDCPPGSRWTRMMQITMVNLGDNSNVSLRLIPIKKPSDPENVRRVCVFFQPPLEPGTGPYRFTIFDQPSNALGRLRKGEEDEIGFTIPRAAEALEVRFVLHVPNDFPPISVVSMEGGSEENRDMTPAELSPYRPQGASYSFAKTYGWICPKCPKEGFTVKIKTA